MQGFIGNTKENKIALIRNVLIVGIVLFILGSYLSKTRDLLPSDVHKLIDRQYVNCVTVRGSTFVGGNQLESECSSVKTWMVGEGTVPPQEKARGISRAICYRITYEDPYFWAPSQTQYEEITFAKRTASKVAVLQNNTWAIFPDQETEDRKRWSVYSCPGEYETELAD